MIDPHHNKDLKSAYRISYLIAGYIKQTLNQVESEELAAWVNESQHNMLLFEELTDPKYVDMMMKRK